VSRSWYFSRSMVGDTNARARLCPDFRRLLRNANPDAAILAQVARCYEKQLLGFAKAYCKNPHAAADAVQDTMLAMMRALHTYRGDGPLEAWLNRLVVTSCARQRRGKAAATALHQPLEGLDLRAPEQTQDVQLLLTEQMRLLADALADVPEPNRSLLLRHEAGDERLEDLATAFGLSVDGVKARLKRTRREVREALLARDAAASSSVGVALPPLTPGRSEGRPRLHPELSEREGERANPGEG
jgi:RNA polymerase sigma-70 factor (ECF subfamily)